MFWGHHSAHCRGTCRLDSLCSSPVLSLILHSQEGSMATWVFSVRMLWRQEWLDPDSTALQALWLPCRDMALWCEAKTAVSAALVVITLTEGHTRHVAESPRGHPIPCSLFAYDVSTLIRAIWEKIWKNTPSYFPLLSILWVAQSQWRMTVEGDPVQTPEIPPTSPHAQLLHRAS